jgi:hypothetical protein
MTYLIDADVLIEAKDRHYAFDFCPGFWDWILQQHALKVVFSVKAVGDELKAGNDQLAAWAMKQGSKYFFCRKMATPLPRWRLLPRQLQP